MRIVIFKGAVKNAAPFLKQNSNRTTFLIARDCKKTEQHSDKRATTKHNCFDSTNFKKGGIFNSDRFQKIKRSGAIAECLTDEALSAQSVDRTSTPKADIRIFIFGILKFFLNQT